MFNNNKSTNKKIILIINIKYQLKKKVLYII